MSTETKNQDQPAENDPADSAAQSSTDSDSAQAGNVEVGSPEFQAMSDTGHTSKTHSDLNRFQDIKVNVSADLGRAEVPIQTLMNLGEGSVLELNREIDSPVELVAQGVPLACGEVVVVNGCFAIRVTKVYEDQKG